MEFLKTIFGDKAMTFDEFKTAVLKMKKCNYNTKKGTY